MKSTLSLGHPMGNTLLPRAEIPPSMYGLQKQAKQIIYTLGTLLSLIRLLGHLMDSVLFQEVAMTNTPLAALMIIQSKFGMLWVVEIHYFTKVTLIVYSV